MEDGVDSGGGGGTRTTRKAEGEHLDGEGIGGGSNGVVDSSESEGGFF